MAITETYVDPAIAGDSGAGSIGDPYGDVQYALDTMTRDAANGDRINIKAGTDEVLAAALDLSTYGAPTSTSQLVIQGYTSAAGDGGIGGISGAGSYTLYANASLGYIHHVDMHLHNVGSNAVVILDNYCSFINCEIDTATGLGIQIDDASYVNNCYFHDLVGSYHCSIRTAGIVMNSVFENGASACDAALLMAANGVVTNCLFVLDGASKGIRLAGYSYYTITNNTIYSVSGTGYGVWGLQLSGSFITNNYIEGFSGVGGKAFILGSGMRCQILQSNRYYNNTENESISGIVFNSNNNSAVASSALTNPGAGDFSVGTDLKAGAYPTTFKGIATNQYMDIGAAQRQEPAGGGGRRPRIRAHGV